jgi:PHD/YefM family antitoxin component YafN of YafNO toxin-antitoxin module
VPVTALLPELKFSEAKTGLSAVMNEVVREGKPQVVQRNKEAMVLVRPSDLSRWLETFRLTFRVTLDEGEVAITADPVGVLGLGESLDAALDDLVVELTAYAQRFFERPNFYLETDAARHYPWLLRFALTHPDHQRELLVADIEASMPSGNEAVASAV